MKQRGQRFIKIEGQFLDDISGLVSKNVRLKGTKYNDVRHQVH